MMAKRLLVCAALVVLGHPGAAQPEVTWEQVGDLSLDTRFPISIGPDGFFWAAVNEVKVINGAQVFYQGVYRLAPPYSSTTHWEKVSEPARSSSRWAYVISRDTILLDEGNRTYRSTTGGALWIQIQDVDNVTRILEIPGDLPYAKRLIATQGDAMASVSDDRGVTWTAAEQVQFAAAERVALVTTGSHAGRLLASGISGITASDDGGLTWQTTPEWAALQQSADCLATLRGQAAGGGDRLVTVINDPRISDDSLRVSLSDDGGETWHRGQGLFPGVFRSCVEVVDLGEGRAVAVMMRGPLWWTEDAGETWTRWAEWEELVSPEEASVGDPRVWWALAGPDGRLYIGLATPGGDRSVHDKRTSDVVAPSLVAQAPEAETGAAMLRVSPNPSRQLVTLTFSETATRSLADVVIVDAQGREVFRHQLASGSSWPVDVSTWAPGVYYANVNGRHQAVNATAFTVVR